jgi:hypothetical protein
MKDIGKMTNIRQVPLRIFRVFQKNIKNLLNLS